MPIVGSDGLIDCVQGEVLIASACVTLPELDIANVTATLKRSTQPNDVSAILAKTASWPNLLLLERQP